MAQLSEITLLRYMQEVYDGLEEDAEDGDTWTGKIMATYSSMGISNSHYSRIFRMLYDTGCMELVRRGARHIPSQIRLVERPTAEHVARMYAVGLTNDPKPDSLEARVRQLERRLEGIDIQVALTNHEKRLNLLESARSKGKGRTNATQ